MTELVTPHGAEAYAALVHIEAGHWDGYLLRLLAAINARLVDPETDHLPRTLLHIRPAEDLQG